MTKSVKLGFSQVSLGFPGNGAKNLMSHPQVHGIVKQYPVRDTRVVFPKIKDVTPRLSVRHGTTAALIQVG